MKSIIVDFYIRISSLVISIAVRVKFELFYHAYDLKSTSKRRDEVQNLANLFL